MQVKSIADCSKGSLLQYFRPTLSYHLSLKSLFCLFLIGRFTQVLLYIISWAGTFDVFFQELLEKALGGLLKKQDENCTNARELDKLIQQQRTIERELSRVLQQLAESSKVIAT